MRFDNRPWQIAIYQDPADKIVIQKASKVGLSEYARVRVFDSARRGLAGMYILPTQPVAWRYVTSFIDPIVHRVAIYRDNMGLAKKDVNQKSLKTIFGKQWNFVGSNSPENFYDFEADIEIIDEYDKCDQKNIELANDRLGAAEKERELDLGNPTIAGFGLNAKFEASSKQFWKVKCEHCGEWQSFDWWENVIEQIDNNQFRLRDPRFTDYTPSQQSAVDASPVCRRCQKPINRLADGEWVAAHPDREVSGYQVSRIFGAPGNDFAEPRQIILEEFGRFLSAQSDLSELQLFSNNRLGIPFSSPGSKFDEEVLAHCAGDYTLPNMAKEAVAGCDVGGVLHLHISTVQNGIRQKVFVGHVADWDELHIKAHQYGVVSGVVDALPELHAAEEFCRKHPGWRRCFYDLADTAPKSVVFDKKDRTVVHAKRTPTLDGSLAAYIDGAVILPVNWKSLDGGDFVKQMTAATRVEITNARGQKTYQWQEGNQPDHHQHADNYERIGMMKLGTIDCISVG